MLSKLSEREQEVLKQRYQLLSELKKRSTLKQIGDIYNITRERVRQIEKEAIRKIVALAGTPEFSGELGSIEQEVNEFLEKRGGMIREDHLLDEYVKPVHQLDFLHTNAFVFVLENLFDSVDKVDGHDSFHSVWTLKALDVDQVAQLISALESQLSTAGRVHSQDEVLKLASDSLSSELQIYLDGYIAKHDGLTIQQVLQSYLQATSKIDKNILDQWGLSSWETIQPKKLSGKILLVFEKHNAPLHFRQIAEKINDANFDYKKICAATVHNELIANDEFVLIGRGIYAKKDWGYSAGTVADIITKILSEADDSLDKDAIYEKVLKQRQVNKSTIYLTLINKDKFVKSADGKFSLK